MVTLHARQNLAREIDIAEQSQLHSRAPIFQANLEKLFCRGAARVRDADIDASVFFVHFIHESAYSFGFGYVESAPKYSATAGLPDFVGRPLEIGRRAGADGHFATLFRE